MSITVKALCPSCKGAKAILGIGYVKKKCHTCDGDGYVFKSSDIRTDVQQQSTQVQLKRRGRPPKSKD